MEGQTWRITAAAKGVVGVRVAEEDSMGSALAEEAMAFRAACTMAAGAYELLLLPFSPLPAPHSQHSMLGFVIVLPQLCVHSCKNQLCVN